MASSWLLGEYQRIGSGITNSCVASSFALILIQLPKVDPGSQYFRHLVHFEVKQSYRRRRSPMRTIGPRHSADLELNAKRRHAA